MEMTLHKKFSSKDVVSRCIEERFDNISEEIHTNIELYDNTL